MCRFIFSGLILVIFLVSSTTLLSELKSPAKQADYIVVYHPEFENAIQPFINWRSQKGIKVEAVSLDQIINEFGDTVSNEEAVRDFVSYAIEYWNEPKPKYLLLCGGINHIPSKAFESPFKNYPQFNEDSISLDEWYAINKYEPDKLPDIAIGRFPARTVTDLEIMIEKTIMFEDDFDNIDYTYDALLATDSAEYKFFESISENFIKNQLPEHFKNQRFYYHTDSPYYGTKEDFINYLNKGTIFLFNFFHGAPNIWMRAKLLYDTDIDSLQLTEKPFILNAVSCSQRFDNKEKMGIVEKLLMKPRSGVVASFASCGLNYAEIDINLMQTLTNEFFKNHNSIYGDAILKAKKNINSSFIERFTLLGDPMLKIPDKVIASIHEKYFSDENISIYPNPANYETNIQIFCPEYSKVNIDIFNLLGQKIDNIYSGYIEAGKHDINWNCNMFTSGSYVCRVQLGEKTYSRIIRIVK